MDRRVDAQHQIARIGLLRFFADLGEGLDVIVDGFVKRSLQVFDCVGVKTDPIMDSGQIAKEDLVFVVLLDAGQIAPVCHEAHGSILACNQP